MTTEHFGPAIAADYAYEFYNNAPSGSYDHHLNGSGYIPVPGDVIVFGSTNTCLYGHVALVEDPVNSGWVDIVEQNASATGCNRLPINGSSITGEYGMPVIGILHARANGTVPSPTPPSPTPGPGPTAPVGPFQVAFEANTGSLWTWGSDGTHNTALGMMSGTSPSITALAGGGYQVAFEANTGSLWTMGSDGTHNTALGMMSGTSPSITALAGGGYQVAFEANTGSLWTMGSDGTHNTALGMMSGTSPSMAWIP